MGGCNDAAVHLMSSGINAAVSRVCAVMPRKVETGQQLHKLEKVNNARDLAEACANIRPGLLFRSACPNAATAADIEILRDQLKIRQLVRMKPYTTACLVPSACNTVNKLPDLRLNGILHISQVDLRSEVERKEDHECLLLKDAEIINSVTAGHTTQVSHAAWAPAC